MTERREEKIGYRDGERKIYGTVWEEEGLEKARNADTFRIDQYWS